MERERVTIYPFSCLCCDNRHVNELISDPSKPDQLSAEYHQLTQLVPQETEKSPSSTLPEFLTHKIIRYNKSCYKLILGVV